MSANNGIFINRDTYEVFYQGCWDNGMDGMKSIGKGKDLEEAVDIAEGHYKDDFMCYLEYGINFYREKIDEKGN